MTNSIDFPNDSTDSRATTMRMYRALASGDLAAALKTFDSGAVWIQPGDAPVSGEHRGHVALAKMVQPLLERVLRIEPLETWQVTPERVVVLSHVALGGESADEIDIVTIQNQRIVHRQHIGDTAMLARAFGVSV